MTFFRHISQTGNTHLALAILRVWFGALLMYHGVSKVMDGPEGFITFIASRLHLSEFWAWSAIASESIGGLLLMLGCFTRLASLFVMITMAVAAFGVHMHDPWAKKEVALWYLMCAGVYFISGGGMYSIDSRISHRQ